MVASRSSSCAFWRERGNAVYKEASEALCACVKKLRLDKACGFYSKALSLCENDIDKAKCCKNLGAANWKLAEIALSQLLDGYNSSSVGDFIEWVLRSVTFYLDALNHGTNAQSKEWVETLKGSVLAISFAVLEQMQGSMILGRTRGTALPSICRVFQEKFAPSANFHASAVLHKAFCECLFEKASKSLEETDQESFKGFTKAFNLIDDCFKPLEIAEASADPEEEGFRDGLIELRRLILRKKRLCESVQARKAGEEIMKQAEATQNTEQWDDLMLSALDKFRESEIQARGIDAETEARALSCIGQVYANGLGMENHGEKAYEKAIQLLSAKHMAPELLIRIKNAYHSLRLLKNSKARYKEMVLQQLTNQEFADLKESFEHLSTSEFLKYLFTEYPPRRRALLNLDGIKSTKAELKKVISCYHPDHNGEDLKWKLLSEEITKYLLIKYKNY